MIDDKLKTILDGWQTHEKIKLNIFRLVSDRYKLENFHSDIIGVLLEPETNRDSTVLLVKLLKVLKPELNMDAAHYKDAIVEREPGGIDIFVSSSDLADQKHCIIIENKINDAVDQKEQLSKYFNKAKTKKYTVDAVVYLSKDGTKEPSDHAFDGTNRAEVKRLLVNVAAFANQDTDLVNGWLAPLLSISGDDDLKHLIKQYIDILKQIGEHMINIAKEKEFLEWLTENHAENYPHAQRLVALFNDRIKILFNKLKEKYDRLSLDRFSNIQSIKVYDFDSGWMLNFFVKYENYIFVIELWWRNSDIGLSTYGKPRDQPSEAMHDKLKSGISSVASFTASGNRQFKWPDDERALIDTIDRILEFLKASRLNDANI